MTDKGAYLALWKKYLPIIAILLKKADAVNTLQFYKYELEKTGARNKAGYIFDIQINNGIAKNLGAKAIVHDLMETINNNDQILQRLRDRSVIITLNRAYLLTVEKVEKVAVAAAAE